MSREDTNTLDETVKRQQPYQPRQHVFRAGERSRALFIVRSGVLKSYCISEDGDERVLGFTLPGELVGLDGMRDDVYASNSMVLETASVCELRYNDLYEQCHALHGLNQQLMRLASKEITTIKRMQLLLAKGAAEEKLAAFLLNLSNRYKSRNLPAEIFNLPMSRKDIGNYLGMTIETISRLFAHFQEEDLLTVNRRKVSILDIPRLKGMVKGYREYALASAPQAFNLRD